MFDGIVRELKDTRYLPQLKRNFISVDTLEALGLEVSIRDGVLKMIKDSMNVLKHRTQYLYYLKGNTVTEKVATFTNSVNDCTQLWHMRLENAGEKCLQILQSKVY